MRFEIRATSDGGHTVVREIDGKPILRGSHSIRFVQQMRDVLNRAGVEVEAIEPFPSLSLAYVDPDRLRQEVKMHSDALSRNTSTIMAAYAAQGVTRIHI